MGVNNVSAFATLYILNMQTGPHCASLISYFLIGPYISLCFQSKGQIQWLSHSAVQSSCGIWHYAWWLGQHSKSARPGLVEDRQRYKVEMLRCCWWGIWDIEENMGYQEGSLYLSYKRKKGTPCVEGDNCLWRSSMASMAVASGAGDGWEAGKGWSITGHHDL